MENHSTSSTAQVRLDILIEELNTTDPIIAKEIARVNGKRHYSKSAVAAFRASGGNKVMSPQFLADIKKALPFLNINWLVHGLGNWLKEWTPKNKKDYITKSNWYKSKPKAASAGEENPYPSKEKINQALKNGTDTNFKIILRAKFATTYARKSKLRSDINKDLCKRVRELRMSRDPQESQNYFAETTIGEKKTIITNVESFRQNPPIFFIKKLKEKCSDVPGSSEVLTPAIRRRLSYDWLLDGKGEMFIDQRNLPLPEKPAKKPERDKIDYELCKRIEILREEQNMSKTSFGEYLNVSRSMISGMAQKKPRQNPTTWFLSRLKEKVFNQKNEVLSYDWILDGVGPKFIENSSNSEASNDTIERLKKEIERLKRQLEQKEID